MDHHSNQLRAVHRPATPGIAMGLTPTLLTDLRLIASMLCSFKAFTWADMQFSIHIHSLKGLPLTGFHKRALGLLWRGEDFTEVWGLGSERHSAILTDYLNIYSCVPTTAVASDISHVLTQNTRLGRKKLGSPSLFARAQKLYYCRDSFSPPPFFFKRLMPHSCLQHHIWRGISCATRGFLL